MSMTACFLKSPKAPEMMSIDLIKALHNNDYHELYRLSLQENFEDLLNIPHDKKLVPIWYMKKEDTWFRTDIFKLLYYIWYIIFFAPFYSIFILFFIICGYPFFI